jgi:choline dehydrogenase-like flavoprotein
MTRSDRTPEVPVVIAGAGPAGLVAAITLARNGIGSLLAERNPSLKGRLGHAWLARANGHRRSTLDLLGQGLTLLAGPATPSPGRARRGHLRVGRGRAGQLGSWDRTLAAWPSALAQKR